MKSERVKFSITIPTEAWAKMAPAARELFFSGARKCVEAAASVMSAEERKNLAQQVSKERVLSKTNKGHRKVKISVPFEIQE